MYHAITFKNAYSQKNTWNSWHMVPSSRPVINPPSVKSRTVDIPGGNGQLDLTESLTGYPTYSNRTGSIEFIVVNDLNWQNPNHDEWYKLYTNVMSYLHGQKLTMILEDDPEYYYDGRFSVNSWKTDKNNSKITIDYNVAPFKRLNRSSVDDQWLWDPFNFQTGVILSSIFKNISLNTTAQVFRFGPDAVGDAPFEAVFTASVASKVQFNDGNGFSSWISLAANTPLTVSARKSWQSGNIVMQAKTDSGTGLLSIDFYQGRF